MPFHGLPIMLLCNLKWKTLQYYAHSFYEKSATPAMIKHGMDVERQAIQFLNPGQIPITTFDQPLFALAKFVQWKWPDTHGEKVHVIMLGGLHTEMALWNTLGDVLEGSGWTASLTQADVASSGTADSYLKATNLTRTRHAHQVTLLTLHKLRKEAFMLTDGSNDEESVKAWRNNMQKNSPTFMYWDLIMKYETLILIFVRAHRETNFPLSLGGTHTIVLCIGSCELLSVDACSHQGYEVLARPH